MFLVSIFGCADYVSSTRRRNCLLFELITKFVYFLAEDQRRQRFVFKAVLKNFSKWKDFVIMEHKKRKILSSGESRKFIDVWRNYVEDLRMSRKNSHVLKEIQDDLQRQYFISLSPEEIRTRINNLTKKFRSERKKVGPSGGTPSQWELYDELNEFLGRFKSNRTQELAEETIRLEEDQLLTEDDFSQVLLCEEGEESCLQALGPSSSKGSSMLLVTTPLPSPAGLSTSSSTSAGSLPIAVPGPSRMVPQSPSPSPSPTQRIKKFKKDYATQRFLELAEEEADIFRMFCKKTTENDEKRIKLLEENLKIQQAILEQLKNK